MLSQANQPANIWTCLCFFASAHSQVESRNLWILLRVRKSRITCVVSTFPLWSSNKCSTSLCNEHKHRFPPSLALKKGNNLWASFSLVLFSATQNTRNLVLYLTSAMQIYTVRLPTSTAIHVDVTERGAAQWARCFTCTPPESWDGGSARRFGGSGLPAAPSPQEAMKMITAHMLDFSSSEDVCNWPVVHWSHMNEFYWLRVRVTGGREFVCRLSACLALAWMALLRRRNPRDPAESDILL